MIHVKVITKTDLNNTMYQALFDRLSLNEFLEKHTWS